MYYVFNKKELAEVILPLRSLLSPSAELLIDNSSTAPGAFYLPLDVIIIIKITAQ